MSQTETEKFFSGYDEAHNEFSKIWSVKAQKYAEELFSKLQAVIPEIERVTIGMGSFLIRCSHFHQIAVYHPQCRCDVLIACAEDGKDTDAYAQLMSEMEWSPFSDAEIEAATDLTDFISDCLASDGIVLDDLKTQK